MKWRDVMKLIHLSDLHIGKKVNEFSMLEDQQYIFEKIIQIIDEQKIECVLIAGDIYDKSIPSKYAVQLFDDFLTKMAKRNIPIFIISGNHDSAERIAFGSKVKYIFLLLLKEISNRYYYMMNMEKLLYICYHLLNQLL